LTYRLNIPWQKKLLSNEVIRRIRPIQPKPVKEPLFLLSN
jgi:hypothetical protein